MSSEVLSNNKELISVIVPVYNAEEYLDECLNSIVNQTYDNLEIIVIDDGSSDNSSVICKKWAEKDSRIKVISKKNSGVSSTRNIGLDICTGDYIAFIDSDDYVDSNFLAFFYEKIILGFDIVFGHYKKVYENGKCEDFADTFSEELSVDETYDFNSANHSKRECWGSLYRQEVIGSSRFNSSIHIGEDTVFFAEVLKKSRRVLYINEQLYYYRVRSESAMHKSIDAKSITILDACLNIIRIHSDWPVSEKGDLRFLAGAIGKIYALSGWFNIKNRRSVRQFMKNNKDVIKKFSAEDRKKIFAAKYLPVIYRKMFNL